MKIKQKFCLYVLAALLPLKPALAKTEVIPEVNLTLPTAHAKKNLRAPAVVSFQEQELAESPSVNLSELFQQQQSTIHLTNNSGDSSQTGLSIRGFGDNAAQNTLILVDGFPLLNASLLAPDFNAIPLNDIERIDIYQGSKGSLWGNQAVGGVVSITTRHPEKFLFSSIASAGSYHHYYLNMLTAQTFKHGIYAKLFAAIGRSNQYREHNQTAGNNIALQTGIDTEAGTTWLNLQSFENTTNFPGGLTLQQMTANPQQAVSFSNFGHYRTTRLQLINKHAFTDDWLLETRFMQQKTDGNGHVNIDFTQQDALNYFEPRLIGSIKQQKIIIGLVDENSYYQLDNSKVHAHANANEHDFYLQWTNALNDKWDVTLGARKAWQNNSFHPNQAFVTEQGLTYHPNKNLSFYLRRDGNFSFPKSNALISAELANTNLIAQTGVSYETGVQWHYHQSNLQFNLYRLNLQNEIAFNPTQTALQPFGAWNNFPDTERDGATIADTYTINDKLKLNAQINYVRARFVASDKLIPAVPAITGNAGLDYQFKEDWAFKYFLTYTGSRYASQDIQNQGGKLSAYWLNNAALQYMKKQYTLSIEVMNLFNQSYTAYAAYNTNTRSNLYYPAAGRNIILTLKVDIA